MRSHSASSTSGPGTRWFWPVCILLALAVRCADLGPVFRSDPDDAHLVGPDAYYHTRRIAAIVDNYPAVPMFDPYLNHPDGALCPYEPGFDLLIATLVQGASRVLPAPHRATGPETSTRMAEERRIRRISAGIMPLFGLLLLPLFAAIARRTAGPGAARTTAGMLAFLPGAAFASSLGQVDHHQLEPLLAGSVLLAGLSTMSAPNRPGRARWTGVLLGTGLLFWRGILLPAALLAATLGLRALWLGNNAAQDPLVRRGNPTLFAFAAACATPAALWFPAAEPFSYFTISFLQPATLALVSAGFLALTGAAILADRGSWRPTTTRVCMVAAALTPVLAALWIVPDLRHNLLAGLGFLSRADAFVQAVGEQRPLFLDDDGRVTLAYAFYFYGPFLFLLPPAVHAVIHQARHPNRTRQERLETIHWGPVATLATWTAPLLLMALVQRRYAVLFTPLLAVWIGSAAPAAWHWLKTRRWAAQAAAAGLGTLLLLPTALVTVAQATLPVQDQGLLDAMAWIRTHTPPTSGYRLHPGVSPTHRADSGFEHPEYGILAPWDEGHHLIALGHRPNIANPFGIEWFMPGIQRAARFWLAHGADAADLLEQFRARFVLASFRMGLLRNEARFLGRDPDRYAVWRDGRWAPGPEHGETLAARLYLEDGLKHGDDPPVRRLRLVWEGGRTAPGTPAARRVGVGHPAYKLFERVPGAVLLVRTTPGAQVTVSQAVETQAGRRFVYEDSNTADAFGRCTLVVPYANQGMPSGWTTGTGPAVVRSAGLEVRVLVSESQVARGSVFNAGDFR